MRSIFKKHGDKSNYIYEFGEQLKKIKTLRKPTLRGVLQD